MVHESMVGPLADPSCKCRGLQGYVTSLPISCSTYIRPGLGQAWLARSQSLLARIHRLEGSSSSGSSGRPQSLGERFPYTSSEETRDAERATTEADARTHSPDYVEARGMLIPAVDHYARALELAESQSSVDGDILAEVTESFLT